LKLNYKKKVIIANKAKWKKYLLIKIRIFKIIGKINKNYQYFKKKVI